MKYAYFISYVYCHGAKTLYSNCEVHRGERICGINDIVGIGESIAQENNFDHSPTIMFYELLREWEG